MLAKGPTDTLLAQAASEGGVDAGRGDLYSLLDDGGHVQKGMQAPDVSDGQCKALYRGLLQVRIVDGRMMQLQQQGRLGFYMLSSGEEATHFGGAFPLRASDWIFPSYREPGVAFWRGYSIADYVNQLFGNAQDPIKGRQMPVHHSAKSINCVSISSPVGTQIPQATGMAMAAKISKRDDVALVYFGEGTTSTGEFHVGVNFAGVWKAPVIFICRSTATESATTKQSAASSFAVKGLAYGVYSIRVDGNDLLAMISAVSMAAARARRGDGPTLIEAVTVRVSEKSASATDPLERWRRYLEGRGLWSQAMHDAYATEINDELAAALATAEKLGPPELSTLFDDVYAEPTPHLVEQREYLLGSPRAKPLFGHG